MGSPPGAGPPGKAWGAGAASARGQCGRGGARRWGAEARSSVGAATSKPRVRSARAVRLSLTSQQPFKEGIAVPIYKGITELQTSGSRLPNS